ncbi:sigma-54-dependent transcriptional regulator [Planktotalea arctica]|uniref:sigma-54-dependent transcriptional regulator n=1 Tax=Planktotalea arctica TaxID=1481893 RepID=UPI00321B5087
MRQVLLVEDDAAVREALAQSLSLGACTPVPAASFIVAKDHISPDFQGVIVSDMRMPGRDGFHLLQYAQGIDPDLPVILLTGEGDIPMAVRAMGEGAFDFLEKPCAPSDLMVVIERALRTRALVLENRAMKAQLEAGDPAARLIFGVSQKAEALRVQVRRVALSRSDALVTGAPGTGISKVAEVVHLCSPAARAPFVKCSGAGLERTALEIALHDAKGGTLFVDDIGAMPAQVQFHLLEHLEQGGALRLIGGGAKIETLEQSLNADLFYRLEAGRVHIPAIAERPEDIPTLFRRYVAQAAEQSGINAPEISPETVAALMAQDWPGNARSLMSAAMRFVMGLSAPAAAGEELGLAEQLAQVERALLLAALRRQKGQASAAAKALKLPRKTFYDKLARYGIKPEDHRS